MEDAARALLMAGNVLIFIIALTVCISSFSNLRAGIDNIMEQTETVQMVQTTDEHGNSEYLNFMQSRDNGAVRIVGPETVISSMYRSVKEDYVIYIKLNNLGTIGNQTAGSKVELHNATNDLYINDENGNPQKKISRGDGIIKVTLHSNDKVNEIVGEEIYKAITERNSTFLEYIGEYKEYGEANEEERKTYRVITYIEKT